MPKYKCLCCGFEQEFATAQDAFFEGWDVPPYFTVVHPLCNLCPAAPFVKFQSAEKAQERHAESHARWAVKGRPKEFEWDQEQVLDGDKPQTFEQVKAEVDALLDFTGKTDGIPKVVVTPEMQADLDADPELKEFMKKFTTDAKNAMQAVKDGRHPDFGKAMEALGYEASRHASVEDAMEDPDA